MGDAVLIAQLSSASCQQAKPSRDVAEQWMRQNVDNCHLPCRPGVVEQELRRNGGMDQSIPVNLWKVDAIVDEKRNGSGSEGLGHTSCKE